MNAPRSLVPLVALAFFSCQSRGGAPAAPAGGQHPPPARQVAQAAPAAPAAPAVTAPAPRPAYKAESTIAAAASAPAAAAPSAGVLGLIGRGSAITGEERKMGKRHKGMAGLYGLRGPSEAPEPHLAARLERQAVAPRLDPNARYATTYRPGGAALAAFDAALARGTIPAVYRDLVGDFGARYAPAIAAPAAGALAVRVDTERAALPPSGGSLHLRVALRSSSARNLTRARLSVVVALDVSGSMEGAAIANARAATEALVRRLADDDHFALVTFSEDARVVVPGGAIGPRRSAVVARIAGIRTEGGTNIGQGLGLAYREVASDQAPGDVLRIVMLLSDGQANTGDTNPESLAGRAGRAFQDGVQTSAFGLGDSFDAPLLGAIADRGAGGYYYLASPLQIGPAFARELDARLVPAALAVEVRVRLRPDVTPAKVYGSRQLGDIEAAEVRAQEVSADVQAQRREGIRRDRREDAEGGMRFFMPSFARGDRHALLLELRLPPGIDGRPLGSVEVRYKDRLLGKNVTTEIPVRIRYARTEAESAATLDPGMLRTVQAFAAGDAIVAAAGRIDAGDRDGAAELLRERGTVLAQAAKRLAEPRFTDDGQRLGRLAGAVKRVSDPLALAILLRGSGSGYLQ